MQGLWARAAQVRSTCRCSLCASPANALARRTTNVPIRRGIRQGDVFLVFSSTIAFEAAVIDSVRKDARSKQWDKVIAEGREQVEAVEADQKRRVQALLDSAEQRSRQTTDQRQNIVTYSRRDLYSSDGKGLDWTWQGVFSWATKCDELRAATGFQDWKGPPLSLLKALKEKDLRDLLLDKRILRHFYGGPDCANLEAEPYQGPFPKKLRTLEWSIAKLVSRILWNACGENSYKLLSGVPTKNLDHVVPLEDGLSLDSRWNEKIIKANGKLEELYSHCNDSAIYDNFERPASPRYKWGVETQEDDLIHLNTKLHEMLQEMKAGCQLDSFMAKICQELLLSRTPPNIHTFNLLLVRFCQLEEPSLVHFVLESMWESHIRPNEITHATVLRFFTVTGNKPEFALYVKRMRGLKSGLALADPARSLSPLVRSQVHVFGQGMKKIAQKARMNQEVYSALITGLLRFFDPEDGMYWYRAMIDQGWRPTAEVLTAILRDCCLRADWTAGLAVWQQFSKEAIKATVVAYEWMLCLCQRCERHHVYSTILNDGIQKGTLTARILDLPADVRSGDIRTVLTEAKNQIVTRLDQKTMRPALKKRLRQVRKFEALEDHHHLLNNTLHGAQGSDDELNAKIRSLAGDAGRVKAFRVAIARHEESLNKLTAEIAITVEQVSTQLPVVRIGDSLLKFGLSANLSGIPLQDSPAILLSVYDHYKRTTAHRFERGQLMDIPPTSQNLQVAPVASARWEPPRVPFGFPVLKGFQQLSAENNHRSAHAHLIDDGKRPVEATT